MTKLKKNLKKNWAGVSLFIYCVFVHPQSFSTTNIKWGEKIEKLKKWGGVIGTKETYTKVPASSGLIDGRQIR